MEINGGSVIAMIGKDCVAIASDLRLGRQQTTMAMNFEKVSLKCGLWIRSLSSWYIDSWKRMEQSGAITVKSKLTCAFRIQTLS